MYASPSSSSVASDQEPSPLLRPRERRASGGTRSTLMARRREEPLYGSTIGVRSRGIARASALASAEERAARSGRTAVVVLAVLDARCAMLAESLRDRKKPAARKLT